jgi:putative colanic acid biosysnthesis UDP-glucose lipid carrier transferase
MQNYLVRNFSHFELLLRIIDVIAIASSGKIAGAIRFDGPLSDAAPIHSILLYFCCAYSFIIFPALGMYVSWRGRSVLAMLWHLIIGWVVVLSVSLFFGFLIHHVGELSRLWFFYWFVTGAVFIALVRIAVYFVLLYLRMNNLNQKRVVIVGYGHIGQEIHRRAIQQEQYNYQVKAVYREQEETDSIEIATVECIKTKDDIPAYVVANQIDEIWIAISMNKFDQLQKIQHLLRNTFVDIRWIQDTLTLQVLNNKVISFLGLPAIDLNCPISNGWNSIGKYLLDKILSAAALIVLLPLFMVIAVCIKASSPGPVFFKQPRLGLNGKIFHVYKFRSMNIHQDHGVIVQAKKNDPRINKVGQFLRRTSLDELPQFVNVLLGEMSIVGPRPHALQHNEIYKELLDVYMIRHRVKPGITGWAQINGYRGETETIDKMAKRIQFDLHYIQHWSLWMDIRIIVWTAFKGWTGNNVY